MKLRIREDFDDNNAVRDEFLYAFCVTKTIVFEVKYYTLGSNSHPYFSTGACWFNRPKTDWGRCGQAQKDLPAGEAKRFYEKWDRLHLKDLTDVEYDELLNDIEKLKKAYPFYVAYEFDGKAKRTNIPFWEIKDKSMEMSRRR